MKDTESEKMFSEFKVSSKILEIFLFKIIVLNYPERLETYFIVFVSLLDADSAWSGPRKIAWGLNGPELPGI